MLQGIMVHTLVALKDESHPKFCREQLRSVLHFKYVMYMYRHTQSYFIRKYWSIRRKLCYQLFLTWNKTGDGGRSMSGWSLKLRKDFRSWRTFLGHEMFLVIFQCRKALVMSPPKPDSFMKLFWTFTGAPVWPRCFLYVPGIQMNTLLNLFRVNF